MRRAVTEDLSGPVDIVDDLGLLNESVVLTKGMPRSMTTSRTAHNFSGFFTGQKSDPNEICYDQSQECVAA